MPMSDGFHVDMSAIMPLLMFMLMLMSIVKTRLKHSFQLSCTPAIKKNFGGDVTFKGFISWTLGGRFR